MMNTPLPDPILVISNPQNPGLFGAYAAEILAAEGFNAFSILPLEAVTTGGLEGRAVVILTASSLTPEQAGLFEQYVFQGGNLIAFCPDPRIYGMFGLSAANEQVAEGYLRINTGAPAGRGLTGEALQFHGPADACHQRGAEVVAVLMRDPATPTPFPAVTVHSYGQGRAAAFTYNLPASIILTRQGNPDWAGQERDGIPGIRAAEMFAGWADPARNHLNQADEQMRLLGHLIEDFASHPGPRLVPLPRLWYFPGNLNALILLTDDGEDSSESEIDTHIADVESKGARMTVYLRGTGIPPATAARWTAAGHEISSHFDDTAEALQPTLAGMRSVAEASIAEHKRVFGLVPRTLRNHWIVWVGWSEQAQIEVDCGIGLDCNYYHYDRDSSLGSFLGEVGNFTGSGLPMKFAAADGSILNIYQSVTQLPDEQWRAERFYPSFQTLLERSLDQEGYSFLNINCHTDRWQPWSKKLVMDMLEHARSRGVPVWTAQHVWEFLTARETAGFSGLRWADGELSFTFSAPQAGQQLSVLLPYNVNGLALKNATADGIDQPVVERTIKGRTYVLITVQSGGRMQVSAKYEVSR